MRLYYIFFILVSLLSCNNTSINSYNEEYYETGEIKIRKNYNDGKVSNYEHYTIDGEKAFELKYNSSEEPIEPIIGRPWVHLIWNESNYNIGDSIILNIDMVSPPFMKHVFYIEKHDSIIKYQFANNYIFKSIAKDTIENIKLTVEFYFNEEKWATTRRNIDIDCYNPSSP